MLNIVQAMKSNGTDIKSNHALLIFFKFVGTIMPTIELDYFSPIASTVHRSFYDDEKARQS